MKQVISVLVKVEIDYDDPEILARLKEVMVEDGKTADQIRQEAHEEIVKGVKELIDDDFGPNPTPGIFYSVEDVTNAKH